MPPTDHSRRAPGGRSWSLTCFSPSSLVLEVRWVFALSDCKWSLWAGSMSHRSSVSAVRWVRAAVFFAVGLVVIAASTYLSVELTNALEIEGTAETILRGVIVIGALAVYVWMADRFGWRPDLTK